MKTAERVQAVRGWAWVRALRERLDRFDESAAGRYWRHLSTADFMNSSFAFAALAVISALAPLPPGPPHAAPPAGVATGACITGLGVVSWLIFSDQVTSGQKSYGPAGVVIALISFLVGFGVCLHLGAVFGRMWTEWRAERAAALDEA
jgi:uncharacterized BrkB/YihY/UPF0761 family membrane protein